MENSNPPAKRSKKSYVTWNNADRKSLIKKRIELDELFSGKNANSNEGWKKVAEDLAGEIGAEKDYASCKSQWNALIKKYESFFQYRTGEGTGEEATAEEAKDWEFFKAIHEYASKKDNYHPPYLLDSTEGAFSMRNNEEEGNSLDDQAPTDLPSSSSSTSMQNPTRTERDRRSRTRSLTPQPSTSRGRHARLQRLEDHIYKRDKKLDKRIGSLLSIFGQMVQSDYPHINVNQFLITSSDSEEE